jgi:glycine dehydrogenase
MIPRRQASRPSKTGRSFAARHIGTTPKDQGRDAGRAGYPTRAALIDAVVPPAIRERAPLALPAAVPEAEALAKLKILAGENRVLKSCIGLGYYGTHTPGVILRNISRTRRGTPRTRRISPRSRRDGSRRSSTSRRWCAT